MNSIKTAEPPRQSHVAERAMELVAMFFGASRIPGFAVRLWDGQTWSANPGHSANFTLTFHHPATLRRCVLHPGESTLGGAFIHGDLDLDGDVDLGFEMVFDLLSRDWTPLERLRLIALALSLPSTGPTHARGSSAILGTWRARLGTWRARSRKSDRRAIAYHYDLSNDFYALWLDPRMVYSCAYFRTPEDDLETAQLQKLDHACCKLRLRHGDGLLDIGCGWGGLTIHAAQHYGVESLGITLSRAQTEWAQGRIRQSGLEGHCQVKFLDYRELTTRGGFDKLACIGMIEHVGDAGLPDFFRRCWSLLRPGGTFLLQGITRDHANPIDYNDAFSTNFIFPNGELQPISTVLDAAEAVGFEVRDVEDLREHYALTC